jgi:hypothetical protein
MNFMALYRGESIAAARIVAVSAEHRLVRDFAAQMLKESFVEPDSVLGSWITTAGGLLN